MSGMRTLDIDEELTVGGNILAGGDAEVKGSARIGHDLRVDGWLEARNVKAANKGVFESYADLAACYPQAEAGWFAGVVKEGGVELYAGSGAGVWNATGKEYEIEIGGRGSGGSEDAKEALEAAGTALLRANSALEAAETAEGVAAEAQRVAEGASASAESAKSAVKVLELQISGDSGGVIVADFAGIIAAAAIEQMSPAGEPDAVVYVETAGQFAARSGLKLYGWWNGADKYMKTGGELRSDVLFRDSSDGAVYYSSGSGLSELVRGTASEEGGEQGVEGAKILDFNGLNPLNTSAAAPGWIYYKASGKGFYQVPESGINAGSAKLMADGDYNEGGVANRRNIYRENLNTGASNFYIAGTDGSLYKLEAGKV